MSTVTQSSTTKKTMTAGHIGVYDQGQHIGTLSKIGRIFSFEYTAKATRPVSLTMPIRDEAYAFPELHPVFQMHLPQGPVRQLLEHALLKASTSGDLQLLVALNKAQSGRLNYAPLDEKTTSHTRKIAPNDDTNAQSGIALFNQLLTKYTKNTAQAQNQPRINTTISGKAALPSAHYIIKTWGNEYPELAMNEMACLSVVNAMGLLTAEANLSDKGKTLLSSRFDTTPTGTLGFEDFCVLQGKPPKERYDSSWEAVAKTIRLFVSPRYQANSLHQLFKLLLCNVVLRNGDAHLKNLGLLYPHIGDRQLAPFFDISTTTVYLPNDFMAMRLNQSKEWPNADTLKQFGVTHCGISLKQIDTDFEHMETALTHGRSQLYQLIQQRQEFKPIAEQMESIWMNAWQTLKS